jgi:hypothetical protein
MNDRNPNRKMKMQFNNQELAQLYAVQKTIENQLLNGQPHIAHSTVFDVGPPSFAVKDQKGTAPTKQKPLPT